jgi:GT2 family glycosyltransferase
MENHLTDTTTYTSQYNHSLPDLSIVLVCWNNKDYLEPCLDSIFQGNLRCLFDVVVVDNGSTDGSQAMLRQKFPQVEIIQNDRNVGLGRASNQGIEATTGRYVLLLNNDTLVNGKSLDAMVDFLDTHPEAGAVGGMLLNPDGSFQSADSFFPSLLEDFMVATRLGVLFWPTYPDRTCPDHVESVDYITSACLLLRRKALDQVGLLDEEYFIYGDEVDLQYRLKKNGWPVYYLPDATTIHYGGRSMNRWSRRKMVYRGRILFYKKNYAWFHTLALRMMLAGLSLAKLLGWGVAYSVPGWRERAHREFDSNLDVLRLCWRLE